MGDLRRSPAADPDVDHHETDRLGSGVPQAVAATRRVHDHRAGPDLNDLTVDLHLAVAIDHDVELLVVRPMGVEPDRGLGWDHDQIDEDEPRVGSSIDHRAAAISPLPPCATVGTSAALSKACSSVTSTLPCGYRFGAKRDRRYPLVPPGRIMSRRRATVIQRWATASSGADDVPARPHRGGGGGW